jgi:CxxC motif-containing protein
MGAMRVFTGNMRVKGYEMPLSVRSDKAMPKDMLILCAAEIKKHCPDPPIKNGSIIIDDIMGTGCNIIATRYLPDVKIG